MANAVSAATSGSTFRIWKIRTMQVNADELLQDALAKDGALREEWLSSRKLRRDPRITRVPRFSRKNKPRRASPGMERSAR